MNSKIQSMLHTANLNPNNSSVSFDKRVFSSPEKAQSAFLMLKIHLLNIDEWNKNAVLSSYQLFDETGSLRQDKFMIEGALNRIYLKGSGKYDWVKIIEIYDQPDEMVLTVEPTYDPTAKNLDKNITSHFFTSQSTNNFCLLKQEISVSLYVIGLNEKQNTAESISPLDSIRNIATANLGSYFGVQKGEWETFCKNFVESVS